jgi:hypothetical protein
MKRAIKTRSKFSTVDRDQVLNLEPSVAIYEVRQPRARLLHCGQCFADSPGRHRKLRPLRPQTRDAIELDDNRRPEGHDHLVHFGSRWLRHTEPSYPKPCSEGCGLRKSLTAASLVITGIAG